VHFPIKDGWKTAGACNKNARYRGFFFRAVSHKWLFWGNSILVWPAQSRGFMQEEGVLLLTDREWSQAKKRSEVIAQLAQEEVVGLTAAEENRELRRKLKSLLPTYLRACI
jgi:hypothetical protein